MRASALPHALFSLLILLVATVALPAHAATPPSDESDGHSQGWRYVQGRPRRLQSPRWRGAGDLH